MAAEATTTISLSRLNCCLSLMAAEATTTISLSRFNCCLALMAAEATTTISLSRLNVVFFTHTLKKKPDLLSLANIGYVLVSHNNSRMHTFGQFK